MKSVSYDYWYKRTEINKDLQSSFKRLDKVIVEPID